MRILIVESEFLHQGHLGWRCGDSPGASAKRQSVEVMQSHSLDDGYAIIASNEAIDCLMFSYQMEQQDEHQRVRQLLDKLRERQQNVPVFLLGEREKATALIDPQLMELIDEFAWILEDSADFYRRPRCRRHASLLRANAAAAVFRAGEI
ncbi:Biodegradative arginine decarboxylase [Kluyvera cryocrescens]|uniref:Biodegradative arginine decarboxylase n=1 Tax=Kluyvera cryocrescens TaxID=580 RepID=A0A485CY85_KLUCR|nr:Biodegradative arginine decarboxylase [Kluyvera cryocrescens]